MKKLIFALPGNETLTNQLLKHLSLEAGDYLIRSFPDGETYIQIISEVEKREVVLVCTLNLPNEKMVPLFLLASTLRKMACSKITLVTPYLSYMRQDQQFHAGESITSEHFAKLLSSFVDELITIDPHLHRRKSLDEIYSIPSQVYHAAPLISNWIKQHVPQAVLIGPDGESEQWVSRVAEMAGAPYTVLTKERFGDEQVKVSIPNVEKYRETHTPVLVDDIISTARTMIETIQHLKNEKMKPPVCIGVHAVFAGDAYEKLKQSGCGSIVTCNTIPHESNQIDISSLLSDSIS